MQYPVPHTILENQFWLSADRCIYWEEESALIVSDLHIGKAGHFRKAGIPVSQRIYTEDLQRLLAAVLFFKVTQLIIVGDLSHSRNNSEMDMFKRWRHDFPDLTVHLVKGNHDILSAAWYKECDIQLHHEPLCIGPFCFCHDACDEEKEKGKYIFSGHIHPGIKIRGMGKQSLCFPCFYFAKDHCVLPAFSKFTGLSLVRPEQGEQVFAIVDNAVMKVK
jgi:DNA ligase-associated metallophosphoesterase